MRKRSKTLMLNPRQEKVLANLRDNMPVTAALLDAGYSENVAAHGMDAVPKIVLQVIAKSKDKTNFIEIGKAINSQQQEHLVRGMLTYNVINRSDKGVMAAKALGSDKRVSMFQPDVQAGIVVISAPTQAVDKSDKLLEAPPDIDSK